jgi:hypothetical protein
MMNIRFIILIFFYLVILAAWLIPALVALVQLRGRDLTDTARGVMGCADCRRASGGIGGILDCSTSTQRSRQLIEIWLLQRGA